MLKFLSYITVILAGGFVGLTAAYTITLATFSEHSRDYYTPAFSFIALVFVLVPGFAWLGVCGLRLCTKAMKVQQSELQAMTRKRAENLPSDQEISVQCGYCGECQFLRPAHGDTYQACWKCRMKIDTSIAESEVRSD